MAACATGCWRFQRRVAIKWSATASFKTVPDAVAHCVRAAHVPDAYLASVGRHFPQWTMETLALVRVCKADAAALKAAKDSKLDHLVCRISWDKRALSAVTSATGTRTVSTTAVKAAFDAALAAHRTVLVESKPSVFFAGWDVNLLLQACRQDDAAGPDGVTLGAFVSIVNPCAAAGFPFLATHKFGITCAAANGGADKVVRNAGVYSPSNTSWGVVDLVGAGKMAAWDASKFQRWTVAAGDMTFTFEANIT
jgi:hypothetical protein